MQIAAVRLTEGVNELFARAGSPVCPGKGKRKFWGDKGPRIGSDPQRGDTRPRHAGTGAALPPARRSNLPGNARKPV